MHNLSDITKMILVKENQEKNKIRTKPDKNRRRGEEGKSQKQLQWIEKEKLKKTQKEGSKMQNPTSFNKRKKNGSILFPSTKPSILIYYIRGFEGCDEFFVVVQAVT
nr:hypothetical protein [Tanacetum cinerariifolium]